jgi:hypothetical protein
MSLYFNDFEKNGAAGDHVPTPVCYIRMVPTLVASSPRPGPIKPDARGWGQLGKGPCNASRRGREKKKNVNTAVALVVPQSHLAPFRLVVPGQNNRPLSLEEASRTRAAAETSSLKASQQASTRSRITATSTEAGLTVSNL